MTYKPLDLDKYSKCAAFVEPREAVDAVILDAHEARKVIAALVEALRSVLGSDGVNLLTSGLTGEDAEGHDPECELCAAASLGRNALALAAPWVEQKEETKG